MKKILTILAILLTHSLVFAQAPQKMSYQAVIRNAANTLVTNQSVGMQISVLQGTATGTAVYVETQSASTNANGLVSLEIGTGTVVSGTFASINWATGNYYIKTEIDPAGGASYSVSGTSQLLSVPYALFSANGDTATLNAWNKIGNSGTSAATHFIGTTDNVDLVFKRNNIKAGSLGDTNTSFGVNSLVSNTTGLGNTANGSHALYSNTTGDSNIANGEFTLFSNTTGVGNTGINQSLSNNTTGNLNVGAGFNSLNYNTTGDGNVGIGTTALSINTTGALNTGLGRNANVSVGNLTNATAIGANATVNASNKVQIGDGAVTAVQLGTGTNATLETGAIKLTGGTPGAGKVLTSDAAGLGSWTTMPVGGFTHYLGEAFNGGIIYYLYKGSDGLEHGLIVALTESTATWQTSGTLVNANRTEDGAYNTTLMTGSPAATYIATLGAGWYLPSIDELGLLYYNRYSTQKGLRAGGNTLLANTANYWSSTEYNAPNAYFFSFSNGSAGYNGKANTGSVRGVRAF